MTVARARPNIVYQCLSIFGCLTTKIENCVQIKLTNQNFCLDNKCINIGQLINVRFQNGFKNKPGANRVVEFVHR